MAFCDNCGHELRSTAKFCGSCGTSRESIDDTPKPSRGRPTQPRKKSRKEELAEYEEEYIPRSEERAKTGGSKPKVYKEQRFNRPPEWKSMGVTIVLTVVLGFFGLGGIGHLYLGKIIKGIVILIVGIILLIITVFTMGIGLIVLIPYALWVIYDSYKQCKHYNNYLEETGRPPW
jgi:TM2 domain-containing membrane protein YozV